MIDDAVVAAEKIPGWMAPLELRWLAERASERKTVIEVGSWKGRSTKALGMCVQVTVFAVDHWSGSVANPQDFKEVQQIGAAGCLEIFKTNLAAEVSAGKVVTVMAESAEAARRLRATLPNGADMVFIDGDHLYESVRRDIEIWRPLVAKGGLMSGHDYMQYWPGVVRAVTEAFPGRDVGPFPKTTIWSVTP